MAKSILFLGTQMTVGGAQHVLLTQALWFHEKGYRVTVAFFYDKEHLRETWNTEYPFPVIDLRAREPGAQGGSVFGLFTGLWNLWRLLKRDQFDVIESFTPHSNLLGLPLAFLAGIPVRVGSHHGLIENISPWLERAHGMLVNSRIVSALVAVSTRVQRLAISVERCKPDKVVLILNGVKLPLEDAFSSEDRQKLRDALGLDPVGELVLSVGRLTSQKGHWILLEAIPEILADFPHAVFVLVGDGPLRQELEELVSKLGITNSVRFLGTRRDVLALLHAADVFVLPSVSEGLPIAMLEAMAMGLPVIASNLEGITSVIVDGQHGLLFPVGEVKSLSLSLVKLLEDAELRSQVARESKKLVSERYSLEKMCEEYEGLFF